MRIRLRTEVLAQHLAASSLSQNRWATRMGISTGHLSELVNGKKLYPSASTRNKLLKGTGLSFDDLFEMEQRPVQEGSRIKSGEPVAEVSFRSYRIKVERTDSSGMWSRGAMSSFLQDLRFGFRGILRNPLVALVAIFTIAVGIAGNAAIFSLVNGVLLTPLGFPDSRRLVLLFGDKRRVGDQFASLSYPDFQDLRNRSRLLKEVSVFREADYDVRLGDLTHRIEGARVSSAFFDVLGVSPLQGRFFRQAEDLETSSRVAVISQSFWETRLGGARDIIGQTLRVDAEAYEIIGVLPRDFRFPVSLDEADIWTPIGLDGDFLEGRSTHYLTALGRVKPGVQVEAVRGEVEAIARQLEQEYSENRERGIHLEPLYDYLVGPTRTALLLLLGAVGVVLLLACVNVASLCLARGAARTPEMAMRSALGASRWRLIRQLLSESLILAASGGLLGFLLARAAVGPMLRFLPEGFPRTAEVSVDWRVLGFCLVIAALAALIFGMLPALQGSRTSPVQVLNRSGRGVISGQGNLLRSLLVALQVALTLVLLVGAGLLLRSFVQLVSLDPGFDRQNVLTFKVARPFAENTLGDERLQYYDSLLQEIARIPGVERVAATTTLPFGDSNINVGFSRLPPQESSEERLSPRYSAVTAGYFRTLGIPLLEGRYLQPQDRRGAAGAVVINQAFAERVWPGSSPLGRRLQIGADFGQPGEPDEFEVVGVVANFRSRAFDRPAEPEMFVSVAQHTWPFLTFLVRTAGDPEDSMVSVQRVASQVDPDQSVSELRTLGEIVGASVSRRRLAMLLLSVFAGLALLQAAVGLYGLIAYQVAQRIPELGIRMAVGASRLDVLALVMRKGLLLTLLGLTTGLAAAFFTSRLLEGFLFRLTPGDPATFLIVTCILLGVTLLASFLPAVRASRLEPGQVLR